MNRSELKVKKRFVTSQAQIANSVRYSGTRDPPALSSFYKVHMGFIGNVSHTRLIHFGSSALRPAPAGLCEKREIENKAPLRGFKTPFPSGDSPFTRQGLGKFHSLGLPLHFRCLSLRAMVPPPEIATSARGATRSS